ncbi:hypothetical protein HK096_000617, partial [Nowakowskiella sp. JEL0078]
MIFLITGVAGFIGSSVAFQILKNTDFTVIGIDNISPFYDVNIKRRRIEKLLCEKFIFYQEDIGDRSEIRKILDNYNPTTILHFAAQPNVRFCEKYPQETWKINVGTFSAFLEEISSQDSISSLLVASSSTVYGEASLPWSEDLSDLKPSSAYGRQKLEIEMLSKLFFGKKENCSLTILRFFSVYGPNGRPDMAPAKIISRTDQGLTFEIFGDALKFMRDFTYIDDVVNVILSSLKWNQNNFEILNVGTGHTTSIREFIEIGEDVLHKPLKLTFVASAPADLKMTQADTKKINQQLGPLISTSVRSGMRKLAKSYLSECSVKIIAIIATTATTSREKLLFDRSLPSVLNQKRQLDQIIVILDSKERNLAQELQNKIDKEFGKPVCVISNSRTPGASGAWNSGVIEVIMHLQNSQTKLNSIFIAILDDDDMWETNHISECEKKVRTLPGADLVVSGIIRHEGNKSKPRKQNIPTFMPSVESILCRNPHIQGSNLFIRLTTFLYAGLFDESLKSTTDRDLLIRISDLAEHVRFTFTDLHTVNHFAEADRARLSTFGSQAKIEGYSTFMWKWRPRMTSEIEKECEDRGKKLFGWNNVLKNDEFRNIVNRSPHEIPDCFSDFGASKLDGPIIRTTIIVGFITDFNFPKNAEILIQELLDLQVQVKKDINIKILILENGGPDRLAESRTLKHRIEEKFSINDNNYLSVVTQEELIEWKRLKAFPSWIEINPLKRMSIAESRTLLQLAIYVLAKSDTNSIAWILDDDKLIQTTGKFLLWKALEINKSNPSYAAVFGVDFSSPPLPECFGIRTQMVDIYHVIMSATNLSSKLPFLSESNNASEFCVEKRFPDSNFHDLSENDKAHLEMPARNWIEKGITAKKLFLELPQKIWAILGGESITRLGENVHNAKIEPSLLRGGNTFVFDIESLLVENTSPAFDDRFARRSDFNWAAINSKLFDRATFRDTSLRVSHSRAPLYNDFNKKNIQDLRKRYLQKALDDILGHAAHAGLICAIEMKSLGQSDQVSITKGSERFVCRIKTRFAEFQASLFRVVGCAISCNVSLKNRNYLEKNDTEAANELIRLCEVIQSLYDPEEWDSAFQI